MAVFSSTQDVGFMLAGSDLSAKQFYGVKINTSGAWTIATAQGERILGIVSEPAATGIAVGVTISGVQKAVAAGTIAAGDLITTSATGTFETAASGDHVCGIAQEAATVGSTFSLLFGYYGIVP